MSTVQVSNVLNGSRGLGADALLNMSTVLKCDPYWLLFGKGQDPRTITPPLNAVPILSWKDIPEWLSGTTDLIDSESVLCPEKIGNKTFAYRVNGEAMSPQFSSGELLFIDGTQRSAEPGRYFLVFIAGDISVPPILRQVQQIDSKPFYVSLNKELPSEMRFIPHSEGDIIAGKIIGSYKRI